MDGARLRWCKPLHACLTRAGEHSERVAPYSCFSCRTISQPAAIWWALRMFCLSLGGREVVDPSRADSKTSCTIRVQHNFRAVLMNTRRDHEKMNVVLFLVAAKRRGQRSIDQDAGRRRVAAL
jgi:hypothetical protein